MDFVAIGGSSWVSVCLGRFYWSQLDLRLKTIRVDLHRFYRYLLLIWADFTRFQRFGRLGWVRIYLGIFGEFDGEFGLVNLIGFVWLFMDSNCLGGSGRISVDSLGFV